MNDPKPDVKIAEDWKEILKDEFQKEYFIKLASFVREEYKKHTIYPAPKNIFKAFEYCKFADLKVVILGQDPYHGESSGKNGRIPQANGLCFSVDKGVNNPPSLKNIFKEIYSDLGMQSLGDLSDWAKQGILLLNTTLTVRAGLAGSHQKMGWEIFTDSVIKKISDTKEGVVFILWGNYARKKKELIDTNKHFIIESAHPSPLSAHNGFFGSRPFSKTNEILTKLGKEKIDW